MYLTYLESFNEKDLSVRLFFSVLHPPGFKSFYAALIWLSMSGFVPHSRGLQPQEGSTLPSLIIKSPKSDFPKSTLNRISVKYEGFTVLTASSWSPVVRTPAGCLGCDWAESGRLPHTAAAGLCLQRHEWPGKDQPAAPWVCTRRANSGEHKWRGQRCFIAPTPPRNCSVSNTGNTMRNSIYSVFHFLLFIINSIKLLGCATSQGAKNPVAAKLLMWNLGTLPLAKTLTTQSV